MKKVKIFLNSKFFKSKHNYNYVEQLFDVEFSISTPSLYLPLHSGEFALLNSHQVEYHIFSIKPEDEDLELLNDLNDNFHDELINRISLSKIS